MYNTIIIHCLLYSGAIQDVAHLHCITFILLRVCRKCSTRIYLRRNMVRVRRDNRFFFPLFILFFFCISIISLLSKTLPQCNYKYTVKTHVDQLTVDHIVKFNYKINVGMYNRSGLGVKKKITARERDSLGNIGMK